MLVETPQDFKTIDEYDVTTASGLAMPITIDSKAGDYFDEGVDRIKVYLAPRSSIYDSEKKLPAETITIFKAHVISINHRTREVPQLTPEQQYQWSKVAQELGNKLTH